MASSSHRPTNGITNPSNVYYAMGKQNIVNINFYQTALNDIDAGLTNIECDIQPRSRTDLTEISFHLADLILASLQQRPNLTPDELRTEIQRHVRRAVFLNDQISEHGSIFGDTDAASYTDNEGISHNLRSGSDSASILSATESFYSCLEGSILDEELASSLKDLVLGPLSSPGASLYSGSRFTFEFIQSVISLPAPGTSGQATFPSQKRPSRQRINLKVLRRFALEVQYRIQSRSISGEMIKASRKGDLPKLNQLLKNGADVNAQGGEYGNALYAASSNGHLPIVKLLLENGANVNAQGGLYGNALQAVSLIGHLPIFELLLENGANVNAQGGHYGNALQSASLIGHLPIFELLLENGANVNAQGGHYGNALQSASSNGHLPIVKLLLENGADVDAQGGHYGNALQAASRFGHLPIVELLLENGADVNAQGGHYGNALQSASLYNYLPIVKLLLENGADVNAQGGEYDNAIYAASCFGHLPIVKLLLENGADINAQGGRFGNALQAASCFGHLPVVELLLENGADVNAQGGIYGNALTAAWGNPAIVRLLKEKGAI